MHKSGFIVGMALLLWALPSQAAELPCSESPTECGRLAFEAGVQAFEKGEWSEASALFRRSLKLRAHPVILFNLALSEVALKQYDLGIFHLRQVGADERTDASLKHRAEEQLAVALQKSAEIRLDPGLLGEAVLRVNGRASSARGVFYAAPGTVRVSIERAGVSLGERRLELRAGQKRELVVLEETPDASRVGAAREKGSLAALHISFGISLALAGATTMSIVDSHKLDTRALVLGSGALLGAGAGVVLWLSQSPRGQVQAFALDPLARTLQYVARF